MSKATLLALLLGTLLIAAPFSRVSAEEAEYDGDDEADEDAGAASSDEKDVLVLTTANFDETVKKHKYVLAEFYAPWCGHCKSLAPQYAKAATALKSHDADVVLGKVDATVETELGTKFNVQGYPTIKWFVNGESVEYNGPRDAEGIIAWIKKKTGPATTTIEEADKLTALEAENPAIAVAYFSKLEGADYDAFKATAQKIEDITFLDTTSAAVAKLAGLTKPGVGFIKNFKGEPRATVTFTGKTITAEDLTTWANGEKLPLILEFNEANSDKIFNSGIKQQVLVWAATAHLTPGHKVFDTVKSVASEFKGKLIFVSVNTDEESAEPVTNFFGLKGAEAPQIVGFFMDKNKKYKLSGELTAAALKTFAQGVLDGTAPVEYKSAPIPEDPKDGEVVVVVGKTVDAIVFDESKDVLVEVYAPWCGHCKQLEPTWKKLAKRFKKVDSVVIAKMDGTENEHPELEVKGFPTIFFKPAGSKTLSQFEESDRSLKGFTKYLKDNAKVPFSLPKKSKSDDSAEAKAEEAELAKEAAAGGEEAKAAKDEL